MLIVEYGLVEVTLSEVSDLTRREVPYRKMVLLACVRALEKTNYCLPLDDSLNAGIAFYTRQGEKYPFVFREMTARHERVRPAQFESAIHNSAPGYVAIQLKLTGPQLVLVAGSVRAVAELQLLSGRSKLMFVCEAEWEGPASCYILGVR